MRWNDLPRSLLFGAFAAAAWLAVALTAGPAIGFGLALELHAAACVALYLAGCGPRRSPRLGLGALVIGITIALFVHSPSTALLALGAVLAVGRSAMLWRLRPARALVVELLLVLGGLKLAALASQPTVAGLALGLWTFFLLQGAYFLIGGIDARAPERPAADPFEAARDRALRVLDEPR